MTPFPLPKTISSQFSLQPKALPDLLANNLWLVETISRLTDQPDDEVRERLYQEEMQIGCNVNAAMKRQGITPHVWSDDLVRFYQNTDAFLFELIVWNRNAKKVAIRHWINQVLARLPSVALDVLTYGDGIGCDSLYLTQAGHRVTYCDLGDLSKRFAQAIFDAAGLPFAPQEDLSALPSEAFDVVVCLDVLEHVPDPPALVEQLARCLKPGGLLIASAPFFAIDPQFPTHLATNMRHSGSLRNLYGRHGLTLVDGRPFLDPVVLGKPPVEYNAGARGVMRRTSVRAGAMALKVARWWSWPHRLISRFLQRQGYPYMIHDLETAVEVGAT